ncbi:hypothetical protein GEMRC1_004042 [Eukaryota sp. GEM-RC1]
MGNTQSSSSSCLETLKTTHVEASNVEFWNSLFDLAALESDLASHLSTQDMQELIKNFPENVSSLLSVSLTNLEEIVQPDYPTEFPIHLALGILKLLTFVFPYIHSFSSDSLSSKQVSSFSHTFIQLSVHPGFTVPLKHSVLIWNIGVEVPSITPAPSHMDICRYELLRCICSFISWPVFNEPKAGPNVYFESFITCEHQHSREFFLSLVNTIISHREKKFKLFGSFGTDHKTPLCEASIHLLTLLLEQPLSSSTRSTEPIKNIFIAHLNSINQSFDFDLICSGFSSLFNNPVVVKSYSVHGVSVEVSLDQDILLLFLKILLSHTSIISYLAARLSIEAFLVPASHLAIDLTYESDVNELKTGSLSLFGHLFCILSENRDFCVALNTPLSSTLKLPDLPSIDGLLGDLFLLVSHRLIVKLLNRNVAFAKTLFISLVNVSPYLKKIHHITAGKYLDLFKFLSSDRFLLHNPTNCDLVELLLEFFSNIVHYQYTLNDHLIYSMLVCENSF